MSHSPYFYLLPAYFAQADDGWVDDQAQLELSLVDKFKSPIFVWLFSAIYRSSRRCSRLLSRLWWWTPSAARIMKRCLGFRHTDQPKAALDRPIEDEEQH